MKVAINMADRAGLGARSCHISLLSASSVDLRSTRKRMCEECRDKRAISTNIFFSQAAPKSNLLLGRKGGLGLSGEARGGSGLDRRHKI